MLSLSLSVGMSLTDALSHTHTHALYHPGPFTLPSSMAVCAAICTDMWLSSQSQQHTQSLIICSKPNVHNPRAGLTPPLLQNTHQHSQRLIHCDVTCKHQPAGMIVSWSERQIFMYLFGNFIHRLVFINLHTTKMGSWSLTSLCNYQNDHSFRGTRHGWSLNTTHWEHPPSKTHKLQDEICTGLSRCAVTCCVNVLATTKPSSQAEQALNWESLASQRFLMYLRGLGGLLSNSLHFHASNFHSLMEWNMFEYWGVKKKVLPSPTALWCFRVAKHKYIYFLLLIYF